MDSEIIKKLKNIFANQGDVKLAYFFGSQVSGEANKASDYDFAVYLDSRDVKKNYSVKFELMDKLGRFFASDKIDVVVLDDSEKCELKYNIIKDGIVIYEEEPHRIMLEPRIMNDFFDFRMSLIKNGIISED